MYIPIAATSAVTVSDVTCNVSLQAATFDYNLLYKFARAVSDEVRSKVSELIFYILYHFMNFVSEEEMFSFF